MSPLVFALIFVIFECLVFVFFGFFGYERLRSKLDEIEPAAFDAETRADIVTRLISTHQAIVSEIKNASDRADFERQSHAMETLRDLAGRISGGEWLGPAQCRDIIELCGEMAGLNADKDVVSPIADTVAPAPEAPAEMQPETTPAPAPAQNEA